jgi:hypothetical protein
VSALNNNYHAYTRYAHKARQCHFPCRMRTRGDCSEPEVSVVGGPFPGLNHWEGGVMGADGAMFCMPLNHDQVLRIRHIPSN